MSMNPGIPTPSAPGGAPMGAPGAGGGQPQGQQNPEQVKQMLMQVIAEVQKIAAENGIDFQSLIGGSGAPQGMVPPPPRPPAM